MVKTEFSTIFSLFRYIAVCAPFFRLRHNIKARFYILPILLFAPLYNVPRFFEFSTVNNTTYSCLDNSTYGPHITAASDAQTNTSFQNLQVKQELFANASGNTQKSSNFV